MVKIDPRRPDNPVVWGVHDESTEQVRHVVDAGRARRRRDLADAPGTVYGLDRATGAVRWKVSLPAPLMGSPVVVDDVWIQGDCDGVLHGFDVSDPRGAAAGALVGRRSAAASRRRPRCGTAASTSAPGRAWSTRSSSRAR